MLMLSANFPLPNPESAPQDPTVPEATREAIEQHAATYVESVRLRMVAQGIPFEAPRFTEGAGPSGHTGPRRGQRDTRPLAEEREEPTVESETSDNEDFVARSGHNGSKRLEDQMAKMAKELEELKKGKQRGDQASSQGSRPSTVCNPGMRGDVEIIRREVPQGSDPDGSVYREGDPRQFQKELVGWQVEHDEARSSKQSKKESPKSAPAKKFQNPPLNRSTYRPPPLQYREKYQARRTPP
ncbi:hypothetical protein Q3G72_029103 [Acer saccharum]|nr:hypothetical protein Q3G72_029103 [Acer saccharum]